VVFLVFGPLIHQRRGDRAVGSGGFCLMPDIIASCYVKLDYDSRRPKWY
jgi:hypothetical protein